MAMGHIHISAEKKIRNLAIDPQKVPNYFFDLTRVTTLPKYHISVPSKTLSAYDFSHGEKLECVSEHLPSLSVQDTAKEAYFSLTLLLVLSPEMYN